MGPPAKSKRAAAQRQPAISKFFAPRPLPQHALSSNSETDSPSKRTLSGPCLLPSKRHRQPSPGTSPAASPTPATVALDPTAKPGVDNGLGERGRCTPETVPSSSTRGRAVAGDPQPQLPLKRFRNAPRATKAAPVAKAALAAPKLTPLEQQYKDLKALHTDKVLAIQVGYKYKFFGHDAVVAAQLLNIMLIPGNLGLHERTHDRYAYCLIPDTRLHIHLQRLLNHGLKVGVVKQTETAAVKAVESGHKAAVFERHVSAVYTKATYMGDEAVGGARAEPDIEAAGGAARYIVCIDELRHPAETGLVAVQPATGDIVYDLFSDTLLREHLETRLAYLNPSEVLVIGTGTAVSRETGMALRLHSAAASVVFVAHKPEELVQASLARFFRGLDAGKHAHLLEYYALRFPACVQSCVLELADYLAEFRLSNVFTITSNLAAFTEAGKYMVLPAATLRALNVFDVHDDPGARCGSLFWLMNHTCTRQGARMLRRWIGQPLVDRAQIDRRLDAVAGLASSSFVHVLDAFKTAVAKIGRSGVDLDRLLIKIHYAATYKTEKITRKEVFFLLRCFSDLLQVFRSFGDPGLADLRVTLPDSTLLHEIIESLLRASGCNTVDMLLAQIDGSAALNERDLAQQKTCFFVLGEASKYAAIAAEFEHIAKIEGALETELQAIRKLLNRPRLAYVTNLKDTHLIEVRNGKMVDALPLDWLRVSATKTVSRFRTPAISGLHRQLQYHRDRLLQESDVCFSQFLQEIDTEYEFLRGIVHSVSHFDCLLSLSAIVGDEGAAAYVKPRLISEQTIDIRQGRHPVLLLLPQNGGAYVPNDVSMTRDKNRVLVITGPNMGGKSSLVKQIALFAIMAQVGSFVPCVQATMGIFDSIYIRMGASDNILRGKSTFMIEMLECASIIQHYTPRSLIILDEIGRGTGTSDGIALAYSILKYIIEDERRPLTLFITHYPSLHVLEDEHATVSNHHMAFIEKYALGEQDWPEVVFLYKLVAGVVLNLYGLNVAKLAGIEKHVIDSAHRVSEAMKADVERGQILQKLSTLRPDNVLNVLLNLF